MKEQNHNKVAVIAFIKKVKKDKALRRQFRLLEANDWQGLQKLAEESGSAVSVEDLGDYLPKAFFKGEGKSPEKGWDRP